MLILYYDMITCVHDFKKSHMHVNGLNPGLHLLRLLSVDPSKYTLTQHDVIHIKMLCNLDFVSVCVFVCVCVLQDIFQREPQRLVCAQPHKTSPMLLLSASLVHHHPYSLHHAPTTTPEHPRETLPLSAFSSA